MSAKQVLVVRRQYTKQRYVMCYYVHSMMLISYQLFCVCVVFAMCMYVYLDGAGACLMTAC